MTSTFNVALSGLNAASTRLSVSANNIANEFSTSTDTNGTVTNTPYVPQQVDQVSLSSGGVQALVTNVTPSSVTVPNSQGTGTTQQPNVNPDNEILQQITASYDYKANLKSIKVQEDIFKSLLNITT